MGGGGAAVSSTTAKVAAGRRTRGISRPSAGVTRPTTRTGSGGDDGGGRRDRAELQRAWREAHRWHGRHEAAAKSSKTSGNYCTEEQVRLAAKRATCHAHASRRRGQATQSRRDIMYLARLGPRFPRYGSLRFGVSDIRRPSARPEGQAPFCVLAGLIVAEGGLVR